MKTWNVVLWVVLVVGLMLWACGCGGIVANAEYGQLIDRTSAWTAEAALRAEQGKLTEAEKTEALSKSAAHWKRIKDAKDGNE